MTDKKTSHGWLWMLVVIGAVAVIGGGTALWWRSVNAMPTVVIPTPVMPKPNAYDYYVAAGKAVKNWKEIGWAIRPASSTSKTPDPSFPEDRAYSQAEKEALLIENAPALAKMREGFRYECLCPPVRTGSPPLFHDYSKTRDLARLLVLESQVRATHGDWAGSMQSGLDCIRVGIDLPRGGGLDPSLIGYALQAIGLSGAWPSVDHLSAVGSCKAAGRLDDILARHVPFPDVLEEEEWASESNLLEILRKPSWRSDLAFLGSLSQETDWAKTFERVGTHDERESDYLQSPRMLVTTRCGVMHSYTRQMDRMIAVARRPYAARPAPPSFPGDPMMQVKFELCYPAWYFDTKRLTQCRLLEMSLALRAYRLDHGKHPQSLDQLVPHYLDKLPEDPFALRGTFRYRANSSTYLLYSIGPDGKDDGGTPVVDARGRYDDVSEDSKGDIVAGVNRW